MKKICSLTFLLVMLGSLSGLVLRGAPLITLNPVSPAVICSSGNDTFYYSLNASGIPANTNVVVYQYTDSTFNPYNVGDSINFVPGNAIPRDTINFGSCVKILGILIDACGVSGTEPQNEYIVLTSGSGIRVNNLGIDFSSQNNSGASNADLNTGANPCGYKTPDPALIAGLRTGSCNAANVIPASPTDSIPPNAIILVFTSDSVNVTYNINGLCNTGHPIYVVQSACTRTIGAFTNASNCGATRYRTTTAIDKRQNCTNGFTYDLCGIFNKDGTYAIRQAGIDTASVGNNGIRRNTVDSCGGLDYSQLNFSADTLLKFRISLNYCNTGMHYLKAVTHPAGSQPVSNTIAYKLVCNDVLAQANANTICSGDSAIIGISSTDPNASFSWTVAVGAHISGASAGSGKSIRQVLTNNGTTKDSVTYTVVSDDAGCTKSQQVKIIVNAKQQKPDASANQLNCASDSIRLRISNIDPSASYSWTGPNGFTSSSPNNTIRLNSSAQAGTYIVSVQGTCGLEKDTLSLSITPLNISIAGNNLLCNGSSDTLRISGLYDSIRWNNGTSGNQLILSSPGTYSANAYSGVCSANALVEVRECTLNTCNPQISGNIPFCSGDSITLDAGQGFTSYSWNTGANTQTITVKTGGKYVVDVTGQGNCTGTDSVTAVVKPLPQVTINGDLFICVEGSTTLGISGSFDSVRWSTGEITDSISVSNTQNYSVTVYKNGCSNSAIVNVALLLPPEPFSLGSDTAFCGNFSKVLSTGNASTTWSTLQSGAQITVTQPGTYTAVISNACGSDSSSITLSQFELPQINIGNDTAFCEGQVELKVSGTFRQILWSTGSQDSAIVVSDEGMYSVKVTDANGCSAADSLSITSNCVKEVWLPNAFSPNGDGINDVFLVRGNPKNALVEKLIIYNRSGNKLFEADNVQPGDPAGGWDGKYKGEPVQVDVYGYYMIAKFNDGQKKILKGNVTLIR